MADAGEVGKQAVALRVIGDKAMFYRVRVLGSQDTLCDDAGSHYFYQCYIQGNIDFIFGNAKSLYQVKTNSLVLLHKSFVSKGICRIRIWVLVFGNHRSVISTQLQRDMARSQLIIETQRLKIPGSRLSTVRLMALGKFT